MTKNIITIFHLSILFILLTLVFGCDKGIAPASSESTGFGGTITFRGTWPDSVRRTHLVVFKDPLNSASDFSFLNLRYIGNEVPFGRSTINYSSNDSSLVTIGAGTYGYIAVAQSSTPVASFDRKDWVVVGIYYSNNNTSVPGVLNIPENTFVDNINIICDFDHLPPQPPGGN